MGGWRGEEVEVQLLPSQRGERRCKGIGVGRFCGNGWKGEGATYNKGGYIKGGRGEGVLRLTRVLHAIDENIDRGVQVFRPFASHSR